MQMADGLDAEPAARAPGIFARTRRFGRGAFASGFVRLAKVVLVRGIGAGSELLFTIICGRLLGVAGAGIFFLGFSAYVIATSFGRGGLDMTLLRYASAYTGTGKLGLRKGVARLAELGCLLAGGVAALGMMGLAGLSALGMAYDPSLAPIALLLGLAVVPGCFGYLYAEGLKALGSQLLAQIIYGVVLYAVALLILSMLYLGVEQVTPLMAASAAAAGAVSAAVAGRLAWRRLTSAQRHVAAEYRRAEWLATAKRLFWTRPLSMMFVWAPVLMIGLLASPQQAAIYAVANRLALAVGLVQVSIESIAAPRYAALWGQRDLAGLESFAWRAVTMALVGIGPIVAILILYPETLLGLLGAGFADQPMTLQLLAVAQLLNAASGPIGWLLGMTTGERTFNHALLAGLGTVVVGNLLLVPSMGAVGAAIVNLLSVIIRNGYAMMMARRLLGIRPHPLYALAGLGRRPDAG